jgi:hypothetical protein
VKGSSSSNRSVISRSDELTQILFVQLSEVEVECQQLERREKDALQLLEKVRLSCHSSLPSPVSSTVAL